MPRDERRDIGGVEEHLPLRTLRRYTEGTIGYGERRTPIRTVIDRATGRLVFPIEPSALDAGHMVLFLPSENRCVLQVLLLSNRLANSETHEAPDRWRAYHAFFGATPKTGEPANCAAPSGTSGGVAGVWAIANIEAGKTETLVFNPEELMVPNPLLPCEPRLVRELNARRDALRDACARHLGVAVPEPVAVGVDPLGIDVRARFGVLRLEFGDHAPDESAARAAIEQLLN